MLIFLNKRRLIQITVTLLFFLPILMFFKDSNFYSSSRSAVYQQRSSSSRKKHGVPNLLIFFVDDWGWGDLGANVDKPSALSETPYMDEFSKEGIRFTDFHVAASVCTPSRASLLTGRLGLRNGLIDVLGPSSVGGLPTTEVTIQELLKQQQPFYQTFSIGKWHLGHTDKYHPIDRGFDHYFGVPYSLDQGCLDYPGYIYPSRLDCAQETSSAFDGLPLMRNKTIVEQPLNLKTLSKQYADEFRERIMEIKKNDHKFFGYVPFSKVHVPLGFDQKFENTTSSSFGDNLRELDDTFGQMIETLKELNLYDNTLIWLLGDNGPWECECQYGGSAGPFKGKWQHLYGGGGSSKKLTVWEGGHRVPAVVTWPDVIEMNQVSKNLLSSMDILPTIAHLMNVSLPTDREYDGIDISQLLSSQSSPEHEALFHPRSDALSGEITAVRYKNFKAIFKSGGPRLLDCAQTHGPLITHDPPLLFNLDMDQEEEIPLNTTESKYKDILETIKSLLEQKNQNIEHDKRSTFDLHKDDNVRPCCNKANRQCRC